MQSCIQRWCPANAQIYTDNSSVIMWSRCFHQAVAASRHQAQCTQPILSPRVQLWDRIKEGWGKGEQSCSLLWEKTGGQNKIYLGLGVIGRQGVGQLRGGWGWDMGMGFISKCQWQERDQRVPIVSQHIQAHCTNAQLKAVSFQKKKKELLFAIQKNAKNPP